MDRLKKSQLLAQITTFASYFWLASVVTFSVTIFGNILGWFNGGEVCLWMGACGDNRVFALSILALMVGVGVFGIMVISGILRKALKTKEWKAPLGIGAGKTSIITIIILLLSLGYFKFLGTLYEGTDPNFDGQHVWQAVNEFRLQKGLTQLEEHPALCNNLVARYKDINEGKQHEGFNTWVENNVFPAEPRFKNTQIVEEYVTGVKTAAGALQYWTESPGHDLQLENPDWTLGCVYANPNDASGYGTAVLIMSHLE